MALHAEKYNQLRNVGAMEEGSRSSKASTHRAIIQVAIKGAVGHGNHAEIEHGTTLHAQFFRLLRKDPARGWKKAPKIQMRAPTPCVQKQRKL